MTAAQKARNRIASPTVKWTAKIAKRDSVPKRWGVLYETELRLKDTRHKHWQNHLAAPNRFIYSVPANPREEWERTMLAKLKTHTRAENQPPIRVQLFSTPGSRDETYGEWIVEDILENVRPGVSELHLLRLEEQTYPHALTSSATGFRSRNESHHARLLETQFFPGWRVSHEPETLLDIHEPSVVDGAARNPTQMSRSYTCDFVVAKGVMRLCIESKPCMEHVTDEARAKCRILRDTTLTRVVFMIGSGGEDIQWLDMGPMGADETAEAWYPNFSEFCEAVL